MVCTSITETGLLALSSLIAGFLLKLFHDCFSGCRDSRCEEIHFCGLRCKNRILTGEEIRELHDVDTTETKESV